MRRMQLEVEIAAHDFVTQEACCTRLFKGGFKAFIGLENFAVNVVVTHIDAHGISGNGHAFNHDVGIELHDVAVFASAWLAFVRIANQILLAWELTGHEAPLQAGWETCTATTAQGRLFNSGNDLVLREAFAAIFTQNFAQGLVATACFVIFQAPVMAIQTRHDLWVDVTLVE